MTGFTGILDILLIYWSHYEPTFVAILRYTEGYKKHSESCLVRRRTSLSKHNSIHERAIDAIVSLMQCYYPNGAIIGDIAPRAVGRSGSSAVKMNYMSVYSGPWWQDEEAASYGP